MNTEINARPYGVAPPVFTLPAATSRVQYTAGQRSDAIGPGGKEIPPSGKSFEVDFCTVARWDNGEIVEENLFYDVVGLMNQIGVGK